MRKSRFKQETTTASCNRSLAVSGNDMRRFNPNTIAILILACASCAHMERRPETGATWDEERQETAVAAGRFSATLPGQWRQTEGWDDPLSFESVGKLNFLYVRHFLHRPKGADDEKWLQELIEGRRLAERLVDPNSVRSEVAYAGRREPRTAYWTTSAPDGRYRSGTVVVCSSAVGLVATLEPLEASDIEFEQAFRGLIDSVRTWERPD